MGLIPLKATVLCVIIDRVDCFARAKNSRMSFRWLSITDFASNIQFWQFLEEICFLHYRGRCGETMHQLQHLHPWVYLWMKEWICTSHLFSFLRVAFSVDNHRSRIDNFSGHSSEHDASLINILSCVAIKAVTPPLKGRACVLSRTPPQRSRADNMWVSLTPLADCKEYKPQSALIGITSHGMTHVCVDVLCSMANTYKSCYSKSCPTLWHMWWISNFVDNYLLEYLSDRANASSGDF